MILLGASVVAGYVSPIAEASILNALIE